MPSLAIARLQQTPAHKVLRCHVNLYSVDHPYATSSRPDLLQVDRPDPKGEQRYPSCISLSLEECHIRRGQRGPRWLRADDDDMIRATSQLVPTRTPAVTPRTTLGEFTVLTHKFRTWYNYCINPQASHSFVLAVLKTFVRIVLWIYAIRNECYLTK